MRRLTLLTVLAALIALTATDSGSAFWRRRLQPCPPGAPSAVAPSSVAPQPRVSKVFTAPNGNTHRMIHTGEFFASREVAARAAAPMRTAFDDDDFTGVQRMAAKTSVADAAMEIFATVEDLLATLPADVKMLKHKPPISKARESGRIVEEQRNVTVTAHLYAASREDDNDFHVIIGGDPADEDRLYMNVEVSGLPPDGPFRNALQVPRKQFKDFFGSDLPGRGYVRYDPPIAVRVSGSLFYDISHKPGVVGPSDHKPASAWEIHPVTTIDFLDGKTSRLPRQRGSHRFLTAFACLADQAA